MQVCACTGERMCSNSTVLISIIRTISIIQTRIQTPMAKEVRIIEVPLYSTFNLIWRASKSNCSLPSVRRLSIRRLVVCRLFFVLQLLIASHKQLRGVLGGRAPQF